MVLDKTKPDFIIEVWLCFFEFTNYLLADADAAAGVASTVGTDAADAAEAAVSTTGAGVLAAAEAAGVDTCSEAAPACAPASPCMSILSPALKIKNKAIAAKTKKPTSAFHILFSLLFDLTDNAIKNG